MMDLTKKLASLVLLAGVSMVAIPVGWLIGLRSMMEDDDMQGISD